MIKERSILSQEGKEDLANWIINVLNGSHEEFKLKELLGRYSLCLEFKGPNEETYNFLLRTPDLSLRIFMSYENVSDAINYSFEELRYKKDKLDKLTNKIRDLLNKKGNFKLIMIDNNDFSFKEIEEKQYS